jgi:hypothetical protein
VYGSSFRSVRVFSGSPGETVETTGTLAASSTAGASLLTAASLYGQLSQPATPVSIAPFSESARRYGDEAILWMDVARRYGDDSDPVDRLAPSRRPYDLALCLKNSRPGKPVPHQHNC